MSSPTNFTARKKGANKMDWTLHEVEVIVADYLQMLTLELSGQRFNKTAHRRNLQAILTDRSDGSIEFKHCNISAVMIDLGFPYVSGYQPRSNYQQLLVEVASAQIHKMPLLDEAALAAVQQPATTPDDTNFFAVKSAAPVREQSVRTPMAPSFTPVKRDYLAREALNRSLGVAGEEFIVHYEHWRLIQLGQPRLADRVDHVSKSKGDGLGYDVLSFESDGKERLIEVKTTTFGRDTPFFVSRGEVALSKSVADQFHLYRLFQFRSTPKLFDLPGPLDHHCFLDPVNYRASFS